MNAVTMRLTIVLAILISAPVCADPIDQSLIENDRIKEIFAELVALGGHGRLPIERAAFLRRLPDGTYDSTTWPFSATFQSARFHGPIPVGTVAIVHTHPLRNPRPSTTDLELARRLGIPVLVLTPRRLTAAQPDGTVWFSPRTER